jgi:outer membrane protein OmpA-like peptidoglycan-associated protein
MRSILAVAIVAASSLFSVQAVADPAYSAKDIVNHFAPDGKLGAARGICIGTEAECGDGAGTDAAAQAVQSYDLLVTFDLNSDSLTVDAKENLDEFAKALQDPTLAAAKFEVDGHTDARGTEDYNLGLSERRAQAVIDYLAGLGIDTSRLTARGFGKSQPRTDDPFDAVNRRVETRLVAQ